MKRDRQKNFHGRPDSRTQAVVGAAVELQQHDRTENPAVFLHARNVPLAVILRVLKPHPSR